MRGLAKGAGVAGLIAAFEPAIRGAAVTVVETRHTLGGNASWLPGGILAPRCERESAEQTVLDLGRDAPDCWDALLPRQVTGAGTLVMAMSRDTGEFDRFASRTSGHRRVDEVEIAILGPDLGGGFRRGLPFPDNLPRVETSGGTVAINGLYRQGAARPRPRHGAPGGRPGFQSRPNQGASS
jgi:glycine oxidase